LQVLAVFQAFLLALSGYSVAVVAVGSGPDRLLRVALATALPVVLIQTALDSRPHRARAAAAAAVLLAVQMAVMVVRAWSSFATRRKLFQPDCRSHRLRLELSGLRQLTHSLLSQ
jgi:hypothetical protein